MSLIFLSLAQQGMDCSTSKGPFHSSKAPPLICLCPDRGEEIFRASYSCPPLVQVLKERVKSTSQVSGVRELGMAQSENALYFFSIFSWSRIKGYCLSGSLHRRSGCSAKGPKLWVRSFEGPPTAIERFITPNKGGASARLFFLF